jgi:capsular polysaccharide transport system permease protein
MSGFVDDFGQGSFRAGLRTQVGVLGALILRELQGRFGRQNIGYLWIIGEPMMLATVISVLHSLGNIGIHAKGVQVFAFTLVGYNIFIIFRNVFNRSEHMLDNYSFLLYHSMIKPFDIILGNSIAEIIGTVASFFILLGAGICFGAADFPARPLYLFLAIFMISWLTLGLSMIIAAYTYQSHFLSRFVHPFSYFMIPLSGAFFTMGILPAWAREYMAWNPLMTVFEVARYGQFEVMTDEYFQIEYTLAFCAVVNYWGLLALRRVRRRLQVN